MKRRNLLIAIAAATGMLILILDGKTAVSGALDGIDLCLNTLIPSLFPFFLLSILITQAISGQAICLLRPIATACKIPAGAEYLLAIGVLGGYPVGAQNVSLLYGLGKISGIQAARMITFCNNAGPAFIFGILGPMFSDCRIPWLIWLIHILSAILVGMLLPNREPNSHLQQTLCRISITESLAQAVRVMSLVCGWVVIMRMVIAFLDRWFLWQLPLPAQIAICGVLELSNGCIRLSMIEQEALRFILAAAMLSLGGICVTLQTSSVSKGISMKLYFPGKILQCCISIVLGSLMLPALFGSLPPKFLLLCMIAVVAGSICAVFFHFSKKSSRILTTIGV